MASDQFLIAPFNSGLQTDVRPWLIPDDAFERLQNAYVFRGRVRKRFGEYLLNTTVAPSVAQLYSRLRIKVGDTDLGGNLAGNVPGGSGFVGQMFSIGTEIFTVTTAGLQPMLDTGSAVQAFFDTTTGFFTFTGADFSGTAVYFYPSLPVMGLLTYEQPNVNFESLVAFDTKYAYTYNGTAFERLGTAAWTGTDYQFFCGTNYRGSQIKETLLFVSNFKVSDQIKYLNGSTWTNFNPPFNLAGNSIETALIILPFKDRLVFLNVVEKVGASFNSIVNRCRYSQNGSPVDPTAFLEGPETPGKGGFVDAPTKESIVSAQIIKDRLIVYFERSTWELVYTGNKIIPFVWQKINTELGAESTFSIAPFDKVLLGIGNVGIHACNGANVERIDVKIPDQVFQIHNDNQGIQRVYAIHDYFTEMVYWTLSDRNDNSIYPRQILTYNYRNNSWALFDDSITAFGYFQKSFSLTWADNPGTWQEDSSTWQDPQEDAQFRNVIAGNQEGFVFIIDRDVMRNAPALAITNMVGSTLTIINHNLQAGDFIAIENCKGSINLNGQIVTVQSVIDANTITLVNPGIGTYTGAGTVTRVSVIDIWTKQFNFYAKNNRNVAINAIRFLVDKTANGEIFVDVLPSASNVSLINDGFATDTQLGDSILETRPYALVPLEKQQDRFWHRLYFDAEGECIQINLFLDTSQMLDPNIAWSDFQLHAMMIQANPTGPL